MKGFPATSIRVDCVIEPFTSRHIRSGCSCQGGALLFFSLSPLALALSPARYRRVHALSLCIIPRELIRLGPLAPLGAYRFPFDANSRRTRQKFRSHRDSLECEHRSAS